MAELPASIPRPAVPRTDVEDAYRHARECLAADDLDGASRWLEQAAAGDHPAALTELAIVNLHGFGREADLPRAVELLQHAESVGGTPETSWLLAQLAIGGVLLPCDPQRIDVLLADSARRGYPAALRVAGLCFGRGQTTELQYAATACLRRATALRDPVGAALFADRLHAGIGTAPDPVGALRIAGELRALGIPVELPPARGSSDAGTATEPPWHDLRVVEPSSGECSLQCESPEIVVCDGLLNDEECRYLIYSGARYVERSLVIHPQTGQPLEKGLRTSQDMTFIPTHDDVGVRMLQRRMAGMGGSGLDHAEPLTLLRYGPGDEYRPHRDYFNPSAPQLSQPGGQRHSTVCVYLNDVELGGETSFPDRNLIVRPKRGRAVMFRNLGPDGNPDPHSLHAGMPVRVGEKWLASCWIRVGSLRRF